MALLNSRFQDRLLSSFQKAEFVSLARLFCKLTESRHIDRQAELTNQEAELLERASQNIGDLKIASVTKSWKIGSFTSKHVVEE